MMKWIMEFSLTSTRHVWEILKKDMRFGYILNFINSYANGIVRILLLYQ